MRDPESGWRYMGGMPTVTGKRVSEEMALTFAPVMAATRIITEAVASLPLSTLEQVDERTKLPAVNHPLWTVLHDIPNPEQDKMSWFDMQVMFQVNWGNAYAEIQRVGQDIVALWPIHPSRLPTCNITRNPTSPPGIYQIRAGQPGEIVYWVRNDDGTLTPIPASDMLHVPGILSTNGITGQSIVRYAANAIGIGMATEEHAGAFFKNGASFSLAIVSDKIVGKEAAARLRESWQQTYGGSGNSYKTLIMEDGMKPMPLSTEPDKSQLTLARQFSVSEVARFWKVPPHMIGDLSKATFSNIEQQYLEFVVQSLGPWVQRWEKAMFRQLLTPEEQKRFFFRFNMNAMLRGDTAARSAFYSALFQLGAISPNDIRELEDWNPVEGGDTRFIPGNNLIPLTKAVEMADAQIKKLSEPAPAPQAPGKPPENERDDLIRILVERHTATPEPLDFTTILQRIDEIPAKTVKNLPAPPEIVPPDTSALEAVAVREAKVADERAALEARLQAERETTDAVLARALKKGIDGLASREAKALLGAKERTKLLPDWRNTFYSTFRKIFEHELGEFAPEFERCGVILDLPWAADLYVSESIGDLKKLDQSAANGDYDYVKECTQNLVKTIWTNRPQMLSEAVIERGKRLFSERNAPKTTKGEPCPAK
jgi:HK97 family phage portal protein